MDEKLTKCLVLIINSGKKPSKRPILASLNDDLDVNLIRLIEAKNSFIALCHSEDDAVKMNSKSGKETLSKLGLTLANTLSFEARKAIIARNFDYWITAYSNEDILKDFNERYPDTQCTKVITMGQNKQLLKIIFTDQEDAKKIAKNGFSLFHVRVPSYNIQIDEFVEVPMCMRCYALNDHHTKKCPSTTTICSECAQTGHRWDACQTAIKMCINCSGNHRTTAPQCPKRKEEDNKMRRQTTQNQVKSGTTYSAALRSNSIPNQDPGMLNEAILKMNLALMYAHTVNAAKNGSFNTELNTILLMNNLPRMNFPDNPPSLEFLTKLHQPGPPTSNQMDTSTKATTQIEQQESITAPQTSQSPINSPERKRKRIDPRLQHSSEKLGLEIYISPQIDYTKPKNPIKNLKTDKYKFTFTNGDFDSDEITYLLKNNKIQIHPRNIHFVTSTDDYNNLPAYGQTTHTN